MNATATSLGVALPASILLSACGADPQLVCADTRVDWRPVLETSGPLPAFEAALEKVGNGITLDEFRVIWARDLSPEERTNIWTRDKKLAESLVLFQRKREGATDSDAVLRDAFTHFVINSDEPVGALAAPGPRRLAQSYGQQLCMSIDEARLPGAEEDQLEELRRAGKEINHARYGRPDVLRTTVFEFDYDARDYEMVNAMWMAEMAALAYHPEELVRKQLAQWGYAPDEFVWIHGERRDTQGFITANDHGVVVCFRGTSSRRDLWVDFASVRRPEGGSNGGRVHSGFQSALDDVWRKYLEPVAAGSPARRHLYVCGHSLGAALAQLAAYRLQLRGRPVTAIYVFGSPLVGDERFRKSYDELLANRTFSHINHNDLVTQVPPGWLGFTRLAAISAWKFTGPLHELARLVEPEPQVEVTLAEDGSVMLEPTDLERFEQDYEQIDDALELTTAYLKPDSQKLEPDLEAGPPVVVNTYDAPTGFDNDPLNDHGIYEYVFKLGCAIVDERLKSLSVSVREQRSDENFAPVLAIP